jgi:hypothetical protein
MMIEISRVDSSIDPRFDIVLLLKAFVKIDNDLIFYEAAGPPDRITSFTSSALPFHNKEQAFYNSPNIGQIKLDQEKKGMIRLYFPNTYYEDLGNILVTPHVKISFSINHEQYSLIVKLSDGVPNRSLYSDGRTTTTTTTTTSTLVDTQERMLKSKRYSFIGITA